MKRFKSQKASLVFMLIMSVFVSIVSGCGGGGGGSWTEPTSLVSVTSTDPTNGETGVFRNTKINATFSGEINSASLNTSTFIVKQGTTTVPGTVTYTPITAVFSPTGILAANTEYTATITTGVKDASGKALASGYVWTFTTGALSDTAAPTVIATVNANNATNVPLNTKVGATFSKAMDPTTITKDSFTLMNGTTPVSGTVTYSGVNATFTPAGNLLPNTLYTARITKAATDLTVPGNALAGNQAPLPAASDYVWSWTTGTTLDTTPPKVVTENPANLATAVTVNSVVRATFDKSMDHATINTLTFTLKNGAASVNGLVTYDELSKTATFKPSSALLPNTKYTATVTNAAQDMAGHGLVSGLVPNPWTFTTAATVVVPSAGPVPLASAGSFGIMATAAITDTAAKTSHIYGDVSLEPGTSNGLLPTQVTGAIHINDTVSHQARADLLAAYNFAKGLPPGTTVSGGADLGALKPGGVLPPGTYTSGSTMLILTPLTLNGSATDVWIFQIGSSLTSTADVILGPGVLAKNVFWVPTLDATVGVNSKFSGTIVAGRDTTAKTGAIISGRILTGATLAGTIALDNNTVTVPAP